MASRAARRRAPVAGAFHPGGQANGAASWCRPGKPRGRDPLQARLRRPVEARLKTKTPWDGT